MTDFIITDSNFFDTAATLAEAGRIRAEMSEGRFAVASGSHFGGHGVERDALDAEADGTEFYTMVSYDQRSQIWKATRLCVLADSRAEAETKLFEKLAYVPGREHGRDGWRDLRGSVYTRESFDEMVDELIKDEETDVLRAYKGDPRVAKWLAER